MHREYLTGYAKGLGLPGIVVYLRCNGRYTWKGYFHIYQGNSISLCRSVKGAKAALRWGSKIIHSSDPTCQVSDDVISENLIQGDKNAKV